MAHFETNEQVSPSELGAAAEHHIRAWWRVTQALEAARSPHEVTQAVVDQGIEALGASAGSVMLVSAGGEALNVVGFSGYRPEELAPWRTLPLHLHTPSTAAFKSRTALFVENQRQAVAEYPALAEVLQHFSGSLVALPLMVREQTLGVLLLTFTVQRSFSPADRMFLLSLSSQCAQALQRSQALHDAQRLNDQLSFLAQASEILSRSLELTETLGSIARLTVPRLTDWCAIYLPSADNLLVPVTVVHQDPQMVAFLQAFIERNPVQIDEDNGTGRVFLTGVPELVPTITDEMYDVLPQPQEWKDDVRRLQLRSVITVPMQAGGRSVGVLGMARTRLEQAYTESDLAFALEVARRAGSAVENAQLYGQAQQEVAERARAQAALDAANSHLEERVLERTRELEEVNADLEAFAYSASHDLRTPMRHIISFSELLSRRLGPDDERSHTMLAQIQQAAGRMNATIDGLLDLSRGSRLQMNKAQVNLDALLQETVQSLIFVTAGRDIEWRFAPLPTVEGDRALLRLVLQNLLDNALKYTRRQARPVIEVSSRRQGDEQIVTVKDNGVGFDPQYAHKLFGAFQRLHHPGDFEGTGIGLANVRRIVSRHGGRVWAESGPDAGASFSFSLPLSAPD
ncbi:hypothetical protein DKM44_04005 [Deinococcus irradiatisoli]|uniref:histidine kinase n=1 Tax=Deinococcus irradiatisoli TaxID=2202254 RepID=A0A2Z3JBI9_9DEIO|nr:ATP-binding protein [Deinococcus irradiatisoli]AWN22503.1 hypothetical protein DKM44_04005 [Deinococcus irradiatisoli]